MLNLLLLWAPLCFGSPSMPSPPPPPQDPSQDPAAIAAQAAAARQTDLSASQGLQQNMVAGQEIAEQEQMKKGAARDKLGY